VAAHAGHIQQIYEIERLSFSEPWSVESFKKEFGDSLARYFVAAQLPRSGCAPDMIAGYCGYWSVAGEAHITNIAVHPDLRGRGIGAGLVSAMLEDMKIHNHTAATLEVRVDNYTAIRLYEKYGFKPAGIRRKYYDHGKKDALIMWKNNF